MKLVCCGVWVLEASRIQLIVANLGEAVGNGRAGDNLDNTSTHCDRSVVLIVRGSANRQLSIAEVCVRA